jgi:hypothetical protein
LQGTTTAGPGGISPADCLHTCDLGHSAHTEPVPLSFTNPRLPPATVGALPQLLSGLSALYRSVARVDGQPVAAWLTAARPVAARWLGHLPGVDSPGGPAAGLRFLPRCNGPAEVEVAMEWVGDDGDYRTPAAVPLVRLVVYGLGGAGGANLTVAAATADGLYAFQAAPGVVAATARVHGGGAAVTFSAPSVSPSMDSDDGAVALFLAGVNRTLLRFSAACPTGGGAPATLTLALAGADTPGLQDSPVTRLAGPPGPCFPCPPGTYKPVVGLEPCSPCPIGTYRDSPGGESQADCDLCPANSDGVALGAFSAAAGCACDPGFAKDDDGACAPCAPGTYRSPLDDKCKPCPAGTYGPWQASTGPAACLRCPVNMSSKAGFSSLADCLCDAGLYRVRADGCGPCPAGFYSNRNADMDACLR